MNKILFNPETTFFSSDYHLSHKNILKYDNRPFKNINEHDDILINQHNMVVGIDDDFFFLGDFCFSKDTKKIDSFLSRLNGNKYFIKGNHDKNDIISLYKKHGIYLGEQSSMIKIGHDFKHCQNIVLNHFAMRVWDKSHHGSFHLYGHSHGSLEHTHWGKSMDVGIMQNDYFPFSYYSIEAILRKRNIKTIDHHG